MIDHALGEQSGERFGQIKMTGVTHGTHEESRIEQMQNGVLDAADILVNRQPVIDLCRANRRRRASGEQKRAKYQDESMNVSKVSVSRNRWRTTGRTFDVFPGGVTIERVPGGFKIYVFGQYDRQVSFRTGTGPQVLTMDHRELGSPNSAAGKQASPAAGN